MARSIGKSVCVVTCDYRPEASLVGGPRVEAGEDVPCEARFRTFAAPSALQRQLDAALWTTRKRVIDTKTGARVTEDLCPTCTKICNARMPDIGGGGSG